MVERNKDKGLTYSLDNAQIDYIANFRYSMNQILKPIKKNIKWVADCFGLPQTDGECGMRMQACEEDGKFIKYLGYYFISSF